MTWTWTQFANEKAMKALSGKNENKEMYKKKEPLTLKGMTDIESSLHAI